MNYICLNNVNYTSVTKQLLYTGKSLTTYSNFASINTNNNITTDTKHYNYTNTEATGTSFNIWTINNVNYAPNLMLFDMHLGFKCNDITQLTSSDNIIVTIKINDNIPYTYKFNMIKHVINPVNIFDIIQCTTAINKISITATSTKQLTLVYPLDFIQNGNSRRNMTVILF